MNVESSDSLSSFLFYFLLSLYFYVIKKNCCSILLVYVRLFHYIHVHTCYRVYKKRAFYARFKGHSRIISTIRDCRFANLLQKETPAQDATSLYTQSQEAFPLYSSNKREFGEPH
jgi:hypothetical protein